MDFRLTDEQQVLRRAVREFAETEIRPFVREWDEAQAFPRSLVAKMAALGLMGIQFPRSTAARRCRPSTTASASRNWRASIPAVSLSVAAHNGLCAAHIAMFGTEAQKQQYLVPLATGQFIGAWGLTEPTAGSDAARIRVAAARDGDGWVINGTKTFITHGSIGDVMVVMAVTDTARAHRGITAFIVERGNPGMAAGPQGRQARHARERHERGDLPRLPRPRRRAARRRERGLHQHAAGARRRAHRDCRPGRRPGAGRLRDRAPLRARARRSSGSPSRRSRPSSGSSSTWPRASRRPAC